MSWNDLAIKARSASSTVEGEAEAVADMIELRALWSPTSSYDGAMALSDLEMGDWEPPSAYRGADEPEEEIIEAAFDALALRADSALNNSYPFDVNPVTNTIRYVGGPSATPYLFLLALSYTNPTEVRGTTDGARLFEQLAYVAIQRLVGFPSTNLEATIARSFHMADLPGSFASKINVVAAAVKEGSHHRPPPSGVTPTGGDRGVDLLVRRGFPDARGSQLLVFGACAAGNDWYSKRHECKPKVWTSTINFAEAFLSDEGMAKCFFLPRVVPRDRWGDMARSGGVIVDRCRLALLLSAGADPAVLLCAGWLAAGKLGVPNWAITAAASKSQLTVGTTGAP